MLTDSHAHLDDARFDSDRDDVIQRAWDAGVRRILTIGNGKGPGDLGCGIPIAEAHDWIFTSVGIHPHDAEKVETPHLDRMRELAAHPRVIAIGETGLDYYYDNSPRDAQKDVFRRQLELACELDLPVLVHTRQADEDTQAILREYMPRRGIIHCFTSSSGLADFAIGIGFMISFSGIVTFPSAGDIFEISRQIPDDRLLIETDCPYLAPVPNRGKRNEPSFVSHTAAVVARARNIAPESLAAQTSSNFARLFSIPETS